MGLGAKILSGISWSLASQAIRMLLQLATIPILARLLTPADFGIYAMALPVIGLAGLLQDFGLQQALVHKERLSDEQLNAVFWINFLISLSVASGLWFACPLVAMFYSEPRLEALVGAFSVLTILGAVSFGQYALMNRELRFKALALIDICCALVSFLVVVIFAYQYRSFWALWAGGLASVLAWVGLTMVFGSWRPRRPRLNIKLEGMFQFGFNIMLHNAANYASRNIDNILIGRFFGSEALGFYDRAYKILLYPLENLANPVSRVMVPLLSRIRDDHAQFRRAFVQVNGLVNFICLPGLAVAMSCSHDVIRILLGDKWLAVADIFFWLGFAGLVQPTIISASWVLIAEGRTKELMRLSVISSVLVVIGFVVGLRWGAVGVAASYAFVECLLRVPLTIWVSGRGGRIGFRPFLESLVPLLGAALFSILIIEGLGGYFEGWRLIGVGLVVSYAAAALSLMILPSGRELLLSMSRFRRSPKPEPSRVQ